MMKNDKSLSWQREGAFGRVIVGGFILLGTIFLAGCQKDDAKMETPSAEYYENLKNKCADNEFKECCIDSVDSMESVGGTLFPGGKYEQSGKYKCEDGQKRMALKCPGSYAWCEKDVLIDNSNDPVEPIIEHNVSPGYDSDKVNPPRRREGALGQGNGPICTQEAKSCGDGTYVGRTGPNCEFAKCPGFKPKKDFVPTENNPIELPSNVMTVKECSAAGGEVFNTFGETSYSGELIGKIEELNCSCACLMKSVESDKLWVTKNGNKEEFKGNLEDIQTFDDCKNAGFAIKGSNSEICQVGEPRMTGGRYRTFYNKPWGAGKTCADYHYSTCPGSCVAKCTPSACGEPDEYGTVACTSDCDGAGSCVEKK